MRAKSPNNPSSLYVHIGFCKSLCPYCDFPKALYQRTWAKTYLQKLKEELLSRGEGLFSTLYVGGGTPTALDADLLDDILSFLHQYLAKEGEFSVEINPETLDEEKAKILAANGVNRASIGAQSSSPKSLVTLGRHHDFEAVKKAVNLLRGVGIENINLDWMYGFPNQTDEDLEEDINAFLSLDVPHLSVYSLLLEQGTRYYVQGVKPLDDDTQQTYFERVYDALTQSGYERYEISNFAKKGYQCKHNLVYWKGLPYRAIGLGASGYEGNIRYQNTLNFIAYLKGQYEGNVEIQSPQDEYESYLLTNLRLTEGFSLSDFQGHLHEDFLIKKAEEAQKLCAEGLAEVRDGRFKCTLRGLALLDTALLRLF